MEEICHIVMNLLDLCSKLKPWFHDFKGIEALIKATPFERLNIDFKGPLPSLSQNKYILNPL